MNTRNIQKFDSLTGIRGILAGLVVIAHGFGRVEWMDVTPWSKEMFLAFGHFGVVGFFVLSGFILMSVYRNREWTVREFGVNRFARIYPLYLFCLLFTLPIDFYSPGFQTDGREQALALTTVFQQSWLHFSNGRFNGPSWTLGVEFLFYASFPLLFIFQTKKPRCYLLLVFVLMLVTGSLWNSNDFYLSHRVPQMRLWEFAVGISAAYYLSAIKGFVRIPGNSTVWALLALCGGILAGAYLHRFIGFDFAEWFLMGILATIMILLLALADENKEKKRPFAGKFWVLAGEISYGVYLIHDGIQRYAKVMIARVGFPPIEEAGTVLKLSFIGLSLIASSIAALVLWKYLEIPARTFLRKRLS
jgi:peptidoglycan/LPS O-acetylase OafA/YrhL